MINYSKPCATLKENLMKEFYVNWAKVKFQVVFNRSCSHGNYENVTFYLSIKIFQQYIFHLPLATCYLKPLLSFDLLMTGRLFTCRKQEASAEPVLSSSENEYCETVPLFTDWLKSWKSCEAKKMENGIPWTDEQFKLVRNPTAYASFCRSDIFGSWEPTDKVYTGTQQKNFRVNRTTNEESQDRYAQLFKSLMSREKEQEFSNLTTPQVTSFPCTCTHGNGDTCSHEAAGSKEHCFARLRSRGVNPVTMLEDEHDSKYICYLLNKNNQTTFHSSYETLLNILADRIEMKPVDIQVKVSELENAVFFSKPLRSGWL